MVAYVVMMMVYQRKTEIEIERKRKRKTKKEEEKKHKEQQKSAWVASVHASERLIISRTQTLAFVREKAFCVVCLST